MSTRDDYVSSIKSAFVTMGDKAVEGILTTYLPFLALPVFQNVLHFAVNWVLTELVNDGEIAAFFIYTDFRVNSQGADFSDAALANHKAQINGTLEEKAKAEAELWDKFKVFARLNS